MHAALSNPLTKYITLSTLSHYFALASSVNVYMVCCDGPVQIYAGHGAQCEWLKATACAAIKDGAKIK